MAETARKHHPRRPACRVLWSSFAGTSFLPDIVASISVRVHREDAGEDLCQTSQPSRSSVQYLLVGSQGAIHDQSRANIVIVADRVALHCCWWVAVRMPHERGTQSKARRVPASSVSHSHVRNTPLIVSQRCNKHESILGARYAVPRFHVSAQIPAHEYSLCFRWVRSSTDALDLGHECPY